jgi:histidine phosphotransferase ChpT
MLVIAAQAIPRGGKISVDSLGSPDHVGFKVTAAGVNAKIPPAVQPLLAGNSGSESVDAHRIQPFYTGLLARTCGVQATVTMQGDTVVVAAE